MGGEGGKSSLAGLLCLIVNGQADSRDKVVKRGVREKPVGDQKLVFEGAMVPTAARLQT